MNAIDKLRDYIGTASTMTTSQRQDTEARAALDELARELAAVQAQNAELRRKLDSFVPILVRSDCA